MSTKIKICGLTNVADALNATDCGASLLGVIFAEKSPRLTAKENAAAIKAGISAKIPVVGVFQNQTESFVNAVTEEANLDFVQLHGEESVEYCQRINSPVIKVINISRASKPDQLLHLAALYSSHSSYLMFDKPKAESSEDWLDHAIELVSLIESSLPPYFFAGGLNAFNVSSVLARLNPYCIDVSSGVEKQPRQKDFDAMRAFCQSVNRASHLHKTQTTGG